MAHVSRATEMHCQCAREQWEIRQKQLLGKSVRCDQLGNYEPQQCTGSDCYQVRRRGRELHDKWLDTAVDQF